MTETDDKVELIRRTHEIYVGLKGRDIKLLTTDPPGRTDVHSFVAIPIEDPEAHLVHKHEWQHIFFKTDLHARALFVDEYAKKLLGASAPKAWMDDLKSFLHIFINGLDDLRVCSLWELIYPQSAEDIQNRWRRITLNEKRYRQDVVMYTMALGLGLDHPQLDNSQWRKHHDILQDGAQKVLRRGFSACLMVARRILDAVSGDILSLLEPPPPPPQQQSPGQGQPSPSQTDPEDGEEDDAQPSPTQRPGPRRLSPPKMHNAVRDQKREELKAQDQKEKEEQLKDLQDMVKKTLQAFQKDDKSETWTMQDTKEPPGLDADPKATRALVQNIMGVRTEDQINLVLQQSSHEVRNVIDALRNTTQVLTPNQRLLKGMPKGVAFQDVVKSNLLHQPLTPSDERFVLELRRIFVRIMDSKKMEHHDSGSMLDPLAYIDLRNGSGDPEIFEDEEDAKGFSAMILLDMSGSMRGRWESVARACKILAKSLKFPFSKFQVWGFSGDYIGGVHIFRFQDPEHGYTGHGVDSHAWGLTPLHLATTVAIRGVKQMPGEIHHLFILSDGEPTHMDLSGGRIAIHSDLVTEVGRLVQEGRKQGVRITGLVVGNEISDESASTMFGSKSLWKRIEDKPETVLKVLVSMVQEAFAFYLRGK